MTVFKILGQSLAMKILFGEEINGSSHPSAGRYASK